MEYNRWTMTPRTPIPAVAQTSATKKSNNNVGSLITTPLLQHRLSLGLGIAGGARGSLQRCAVQLAQCDTASAATSLDSKVDSTDSVIAGNAAASRLLTDLSLQQIEMTKLILQIQRNTQELQAFQELPSGIRTSNNSSNNNSISIRNTGLHQQLQRQQQVRSCLHEYDALAAVTVSHHMTAQGTLQQEWDTLQEQHAMAETALQDATVACQIRASQFHLLQQCIQDMKHTITTDDSVRNTPTEARRSVVGSTLSKDATTRKETAEPVPMDVDGENGGVHDEGELYGDL